MERRKSRYPKTLIIEKTTTDIITYEWTLTKKFDKTIIVNYENSRVV